MTDRWQLARVLETTRLVQGTIFVQWEQDATIWVRARRPYRARWPGEEQSVPIFITNLPCFAVGYTACSRCLRYPRHLLDIPAEIVELLPQFSEHRPPLPSDWTTQLWARID